MFNEALWGLLITTFIVAATHTISPDHWFGFVMLGRTKKWSILKTLLVASIAGIGHVGTSVIISLIAVWAGATLAHQYASIAEIATGWALIIFGFGFALYSYLKGGHSHHSNPIVNTLFNINDRDVEKLMHMHGHCGHDHELDHHHSHGGHDHKDHDHEFDHPHGHTHEHRNHEHESDHHHSHGGHDHKDHEHEFDHHHGHTYEKKNRKRLDAGYGLVAIIGLTPCVLLIPLALRAGEMGMIVVILTIIVFFVATMAAILILVASCLKGFQAVKFEFFEKYGEVITGIVIGIMGVLVVSGLI